MTPELAAGLRAAVTTGLRRPTESVPEIFSDVVRPYLIAAVGAAAVEGLVASSRSRADALAAARAGRLEEASAALEGIEARGGTSSGVERLMSESALASARSYIAFRLADPAAARDLIRLSLEIDLELIEYWGILPLELHRIQLARNRERVDRTHGDGGAELLLPHIVDHLAGGPGWPELLGRRAHIDVGLLPDRLVSQSVDDWLAGRTQAMVEVASGARRDDDSFELSTRSTSRFPTLSALDSVVRLRDDVSAQLSIARDALQRGPGDEPASWFALLMIVGRLALQSCTTEGIALAVDIDREIHAMT